MSNVMEYKGYYAKIEFSAEDNTFVGRVLGINDTLMFDGNTADELWNMFAETIEDYMEIDRQDEYAPVKVWEYDFLQAIHTRKGCLLIGVDDRTRISTWSKTHILVDAVGNREKLMALCEEYGIEI